MKKQLFWILVALIVFSGFLLHKDPTSAQSENGSLPLSAFTAGDLVVCRVGDGTASLANTGNSVFLDEFTPAGTLVQSIAFPTSGATALIASGTAASECLITRSPDGQSIVVTGYNTAPSGSYAAAAGTPTTNVVSSTTTVGAGGGTAVPRIAAIVSANGSIDFSTTTTQFSAGNIRSGVRDGSNLWLTGSNSGIISLPIGGSGAGTVVSSTQANLRAINIFGGQLYVTSGSGSNKGVNNVGSGEPTTTGNTTTLLVSDTAGSPYEFFFADLDAGVPGVDTAYVVDDAATGGIQKYSLVSGTWTLNGTAGAGSDLYRGLAGSVSGTTVTLYSARKGGSGATGGGELVSLVDSTGYNQAITATPTLLATAATNTAFRGVALAPVAAATPTPTPPSPYAGTWAFTHTPTSITNTTCDPSGVGVPKDDGIHTIDSAGHFAFSGGGTAIDGVVQPNGTWSATLGASTGCTSAGTASGTCSSTSFCSGTYSYSGNNGTFSFTLSNGTPTPTPAPAVTSVNPNTGLTTGGTSVTITGTNLSGATAVTFGGTAATAFTINGATSISATSPAHAAGPVDVVVTTSGGTSATSAADQFTYTAPPTPTPTPAPSVASVSPNTGLTTGGTSVTITGTNLSGATAVSFGGTAATAFTVNSATSISATSPAHAVGIVDVTVTTSGGTSSTSASDQFTYTAPTPTPSPTVTPTPTPTPGPNFVAFSSSNYNVDEFGGHADVTVVRSGDASGTASVDYTTFDETLGVGHATQASDYEIALGTLTFAPGEVSKTFPVLIVDDKLVEGNETIGLTLSNPAGTGVSLGTPTSAEVTILDNDSVGSTTNPADDPRFFARQHYLDFLNREPDTSGWDFWTGVITQCGTDAACTEVHRINVSAAFFLSKEFQNTGYLAYVTHRSAFGATATGSPAPVLYNTFMHDVQELGKGYVDLQQGADQVLETNKVAYFNDFVTRPAFLAKYPANLTNQQFVDNLLATANLSPDDYIVNMTNGQAGTSTTTAAGARRDTSFGTAHFVWNSGQTALTMTGTVNNIDFTGTQSVDANDNLSGANVHAGSSVGPGVTGPIVFGFNGTPQNDTNPSDAVLTAFASGIGGTFISKWDAPEGNGTTLAAQLANLRGGHAYINFSTFQFPNGEIRGDMPSLVSFRDSLVTGLSGGSLTRAGVVRAVAENTFIQNREFNAGFVTMQYFGYLRRDPDAPGFNFWLTKLNSFGGNFVQAEMVKAFISSTEYRQRFGTN
jgi:hypothetical protein